MRTEKRRVSQKTNPERYIVDAMKGQRHRNRTNKVYSLPPKRNPDAK